MEKWKKFCQRKDVIFTLQRYGIDALGAMAQGLFCTLLVGTILNTIGTQFGIAFLQDAIVSIGKGEGAVSYTIGGLCSAMVGPGIAVAIGFALHCPSLVLFSLIPVGFAANAMGGAGGPLSVYFVAIVAAECGKLVSKETKIDILVTPIVTVIVGILVADLVAAPIGAAAASVGTFVRWATVLQPFFMGILVSVVIGVALTLPISSAAICAALSLTGLAGGAAVAGRGHQYAPDAQHREKPQNLDSPHAGLRHHRPSGYLPVQAGDERCRRVLRHGHLRLCGADRRLYRLAQ